MDDVVIYLYAKGLYLLAILAAIKVVVILMYRGLDIGYVFENFLLVYTDQGVGATPERIRFRKIHNLFTVLFYVVLVAWLAIVAIVKLVR